MPAPTLPVSSLIRVSVNLSPKAAQIQNLSTLLMLGSSDVIDVTERYRVYGTVDAVAADFGTTAPEYFGAVLWFQQQPQPAALLVGRWAQTATSAVLKGATLSAAQQLLSNFTSITNGEFTYTKDGGSATTTAAINFSTATNLPSVAAFITAQTPGVTFTWNSVFQRFEAKCTSTGATSAMSFLTAPGSGTDISLLLGMRATSSGAYTVPGVALETALQAVTYFDANYGQTFYGLTVLGAADADHLSIAAYIDATDSKHIYGVTTQSAGVLVAATTSDIAYQLAQLNLLRTFVQYSSSSPYAVVSALARMLTTDFTGNNTVITLMYKQEPGIIAENLNATQLAALVAKKANVFANYNNGTAIIQPGQTTNATFLDIVTGTDWLALASQTALYNLLYLSSTKIPQTDAGAQLMLNTVEAICIQGVINGLLAPGVWTNNGFGTLKQNDFLPKGYYVYAPSVNTQNVSDRAARKAVPIQVAAKLAGAVHTIAMTINVNN